MFLLYCCCSEITSNITLSNPSQEQIPHQIQYPWCICLVPQGSRAPGRGRAALQRRSRPACTSAPPPPTECGRRGRWAVVPGSASETRGLKVTPWPRHPRGDSTEAVLGVDWSGGEPRRWRCGRAGRPESGPQGEGEVLYWRGEAEVSRRSVGSVKGQAELSSPGDAPPPHAGPWRRDGFSSSGIYKAEHGRN